MKFKVTCAYNSDFNIYSIVNDIWNIDGKYDLTYGDDYTHLIIFNSPNCRINISKENIYGFIQEPSWKINLMNISNLSSYCNKIFYPKKIFENVIESPTIMLHHCWFKPQRGEIQYQKFNTKTLIEKEHKKDRTLSIIVSNRQDICEIGDDKYYRRQKFIETLLNSDLDFDMYGLGWNLNDNRYKGYLFNKIDGLSRYKYSICLENCNENGYITEKFIDSLLTNTIPIYNGAPDIEKYYPNMYEYLNLEGDVVNDIKKIISLDKTYNLEIGRKLYTEKYNPLKIISEI
jgi:hypothetical protein